MYIIYTKYNIYFMGVINMKKKLFLLITASTLLIVGCTKQSTSRSHISNPKTANSTTNSITSISTENSNNISETSNETILSMLNNASIELKKTGFAKYKEPLTKEKLIFEGQISLEDSRIDVFIGTLLDISELTIEQAQTDVIVARFFANISDKFYITAEKQHLQAIFEYNEHNALQLRSIGLLDNSPKRIEIEPTIPFDVSYILIPGKDEIENGDNKLIFEVYADEYSKKKHYIKGAKVELNEAINGIEHDGTYFITIPVSDKYIKKVEILPDKSSKCDTKSYDNLCLKLTLSNSLEIYGCIQASYRKIDDENATFADYWFCYFKENRFFVKGIGGW